MNESQTKGYWSIAAQKHLKEFVTYGENLDELDSMSTAGKTGLFLGSIRGNGQINDIKKIEKMANQVGIRKNELHRIILPQLEESSNKQVELIKDGTGDIVGLEENVFDSMNTLNIAGKVFDDLHPSNIEKIAIESMEETKKVPYRQDELTQIMTERGYTEQDISLMVNITAQYKLLRKLMSNRKNPIISNEYIWGSNNDKIARAIGELQKIQKDNLGEIIELIRSSQGIPLDKLSVEDRAIFDLAKKIGMISPINIVTGRELSKEFEFTQSTIEPITEHDDIFDDVKLLLASIRFGENYTNYSTIESAERFIRFWLDNTYVGPHDANRTDYIMLEKKGIVQVTYDTKNRWSRYYNAIVPKTGYFLKLMKRDVAEAALQYLQGMSSNSIDIDDETDFTGVISTNNYRSAEAERIRMGDIPEQSKEADEYIQKILRDEFL